uniref:WD40 repeat-containing protein n=1 Tax=uncultured marine group II/III euryarchaeote KM3_87_G11 TaxID=1456534 RepID=A0A075I1G2_9EURY|nr:WD40 repeat-containing protein [uncultured marine group II/III euryarchaeote KM3_87_G11]
MKLSSRAIVMALLMVGVTISLAIPAVAVDGDNDGIDDALDDCPFSAGNSSIGSVGCPDETGNGIPDSEEETTGDWGEAGRELYESTGGGWGGSAARAVAWAPDGVYLAGGGDSNDIMLYSSGGFYLSTLHSMTDDLLDLEFSPNGSYLAASSEYNVNYTAGRVTILEMDWTTNSASVLQEIGSFHGDDVKAVAWTHDGSFLFTGSSDHMVRQFSTSNWSEVRNYTMLDPVTNVEPSPDGRLIATTHGQELSVNWTVNGSTYLNVHNHSGTVRGLDISPDGRWIATTGDDNYGRVYNLSNGSIEFVFTGSRDINEVSFSPDGGFMAVANDGSSSQIYRLGNGSSVVSFGSFGTSNQNRGTYDVDWSPDGTKIAFAQRRGRITMYVLPEGYLQIKGDVTSELMLSSWRSEWPSDGRPLSHNNMSTSSLTQALCNGDNIVGTLSHGAPPHLAARLSNWSTTGLLDCAQTQREILELPIGRMPAALFVKENGTARTCMEATGGLSMAQLRWIFSSASSASLSQTGWAPGISLSSAVPNDDGDGIREWSDLHPSCPQEGLHLTGRWDNRSVPMMMERMLTCSDCQFSEGFFTSSNQRYRFELETRSGIVFSVSQVDDTLGFTELKVALDTPGLYYVPIADNWTHGAADHIAAGGGLILPSINNSSLGSWPVQDDYIAMVGHSKVDHFFSLLTWLLSTEAQDEWSDMGFVRLGHFARVMSWARIGVDGTHILPDTDGDSVWDGVDDCAGTWIGWEIDEFGCAQHQIDTDGDGIFNHEDDCINASGNSTWPEFGCPDEDGDGWTDESDAFPLIESQWFDSDSDGYGDNSSGLDADDCPSSFGNSTVDRLGCLDTDGDGYSDEDGDWTITDGADVFPVDSAQWVDTDYDGWGDNHSFDLDDDGLRVNAQGDAFPNDVTQWRDIDGDGYGDNPSGDLADDCPNAAGHSTEDSLGCPDGDGDGWSDSADAFPNEVSQWADGDDDGYGDNWNGASPDECIETPYGERNDVNSKGCGPSERDTDTDGIVDSNDFCPNTPINEAPWVHPDGCAESETDSDGDGVFNPVDGPNGLFKNEPSQSADSDGDGLGDNPDGVNGDDCPNRAGDSSKDRDGCPDEDSDGFSDPDSEWTTEDGADAWTSEPTQWSDIDGDGYYDNYGDPTWTPGREADWPGQYVEGARNPDACPTESSPFADPPGCPPYSGGGNSNIGAGSTSGGGLPFGLIAILVIVVLAIGGLVAAIVVKQKKPKKTRGRLQQALDVVDEAGGEGDWNAHGSETGDVDASASVPEWKLEGEVGDDGFEWLEWPVNSERWWFRNDSGYWDEWVD